MMGTGAPKAAVSPSFHQSEIKRLGDRAVVFIAHRLGSVACADRIVVIEVGVFARAAHLRHFSLTVVPILT